MINLKSLPLSHGTPLPFTMAVFPDIHPQSPGLDPKITPTYRARCALSVSERLLEAFSVDQPGEVADDRVRRTAR
jgi:hypothetical protein